VKEGENFTYSSVLKTSNIKYQVRRRMPTAEAKHPTNPFGLELGRFYVCE
jgi:hypothetical protein